jgi:hypothetical protein
MFRKNIKFRKNDQVATEIPSIWKLLEIYLNNEAKALEITGGLVKSECSARFNLYFLHT